MSQTVILRLAALLLMLVGRVSASSLNLEDRSSLTLFDKQRQREIPVEIYGSPEALQCRPAETCPVAMISSGYGIGHTEYSFLAASLNRLGYLAVAIQHELPSDPPLSTRGDLFATRAPNWRRGAETIRFVVSTLSKSHREFDWQRPVLVGHSNGGDISAWLVEESPDFAAAVITLDHRRVPLPRRLSPRVLTIRASDFPADEGVLPTADEQQEFGACVVAIPNARHNDMFDGGSAELKRHIVETLEAFLGDRVCGAVAPPAGAVVQPTSVGQALAGQPHR